MSEEPVLDEGRSGDAELEWGRVVAALAHYAVGPLRERPLFPVHETRAAAASALARTREAVLLVDGSKLGSRSFAHAGRLDQIDVVITDAPLDEEATQTFEHAGVRVLIA